MKTLTPAEVQAEKDARARWANDPVLRAEFCDNIENALAYFRAEARGVLKINGGNSVLSVNPKGSA